ncbi:ankyrin repeat domain-containing protein [Pseudomonadota bacterium]
MEREKENLAVTLIKAAKNGDIETVEFLIDAKVDVNQADKHGWTALMSAAQKGHTKIAQTLIGARAEVHQISRNGWTALMLAAKYGHIEIAQILIGAEVNVDQADKDGWTALIFAAKYGGIDTLDLLLQHTKKVHDVKSAQRIYNESRKGGIRLGNVKKASLAKIRVFQWFQDHKVDFGFLSRTNKKLLRLKKQSRFKMRRLSEPTFVEFDFGSSKFEPGSREFVQFIKQSLEPGSREFEQLKLGNSEFEPLEPGSRKFDSSRRRYSVPVALEPGQFNDNMGSDAFNELAELVKRWEQEDEESTGSHRPKSKTKLMPIPEENIGLCQPL